MSDNKFQEHLNKMKLIQDHPASNDQYTFIASLFEESSCQKWLDTIHYGNSCFKFITMS